MEKDTHEHEAELELEATNEDNVLEPELESVEAHTTGKLKALREKLKAAEDAKMDALEQLQRTKADFLNARKRLEEERLQERERALIAHAEELLPLYDSFAMAMQNKTAWEAIDKNWRIGVEGIFSQLQSLLESYGVTAVSPQGQPFDPQLHEALGNEPVAEESLHDTITRVVQVGFVRTRNGQTATIRPARVMVGTYTTRS